MFVCASTHVFECACECATQRPCSRGGHKIRLCVFKHACDVIDVGACLGLCVCKCVSTLPCVYVADKREMCVVYKCV